MNSSNPTPTTSGNGEESSLISRIKKGFISSTTSAYEGLCHMKASLIGLVKMITAKDEREATQAELETAKMQVEATNAAEKTKKRLEM